MSVCASASFGGRSGALRANKTVGRAKSKRDSVSLEREATKNIFSVAGAYVETIERQEDIIDNIIFNKL